MFIKCNKKLNKRGFTLAESVLALAIISIVSVSTLSLILSAQRSTISAAQKQQAQLYAADIISCYRVSDTDNFAENVKFALGKPIDDNTIALSDDLTAHIDQEGKTLKVTVKNGQGSELSTLTFTKGGTQNEEVTQ
ncbi:MAG: type II secretion system protein [Clostridia bacterium]|nr:type II secretion system protein [Clostridia bacterium]